ncbi:MAG: YbjN domain-containing protein [Actinobacteria bacterium]|nr:YbjN domain-containing protein [Actinomycetota bacterium]
MADRPASPAELDRLQADIERWLDRQRQQNPLVEAVDVDDTGERRWFVRLKGEQKDHTTVWLHLRQRTLHYETYVMPAPEEDHARFYEHLLRRNLTFHGAAFAIGDEDAVFLVGALPVDTLDEGELDRILGSLYAYVERCFRPALRIGFGSRFRDT